MSKRIINSPFETDRSYGFPEEIMREIQNQREEVDRIRKERLKVQELKDQFARKEIEMARLQTQNKQLLKYKPFHDKYLKLKELLDDSALKYDNKERQNNKLFNQLQKSLVEIDTLQKKVADSDKNRLSLIKERSHLERINKQIEQVFYQYKKQCKAKEKELIDKLEKAYRQIKQQRKLIEQLQESKSQQALNRKKIQQLELQKKELEDHKNHLNEMLKIKEHQINAMKMDMKKVQQIQEPESNNSKQNYKADEIEKYELLNENQELRKELFEKDRELQKSKALNHELSIQFDRSVTRIGQFQRELSEYRRENHELKKTLTLFIQKDEYDKLHKQELLKKDDQDESFLESDQQIGTYQQKKSEQEF